MSRIKLSDNTMDIVIKMSEGNPGAISVLYKLLQPKTNLIDPDTVMGRLGNILSLDTLGIYGADIDVLMNDICGNDMVKFITVIRSPQLGFLKEEVLRDACSRRDYSGRDMINIEDLYKKVKEQLPRFADLPI